MARGRAAGIDSTAVLRRADADRAGGQLFRLWTRADDPGVHFRQLYRTFHLKPNSAIVSHNTQIRGNRLGRYAGDRLYGCVFSRLSRKKSALADWAVFALHGAVLDLEYHSDDLLDSVSGAARGV